MSALSIARMGLLPILFAQVITQAACGGDSSEPGAFHATTLSFSPAPSLKAPGPARSAVVKDFNRDGVVDIAVATGALNQPGDFLVYTGGSGFQPALPYPAERPFKRRPAPSPWPT